MPDSLNLRSKIAVLSVFILVLSIVRIAYEFHFAQRSIDQLTGRTDNSLPSSPHLSQPPDFSPLPPPPSPPSPVDLSKPLSPSRGFSHPRAVPTKQKWSRAPNSDKKIDSDDDQYGGHNTRRVPVSLTESRDVSLSPAASASGGRRGVMNIHPLLVIVVCSRPQNTNLRLAIRKSWGLEVDTSKVIVRFFVGQDDEWDNIIAREQELHGDVIRTVYVDTYENLSYKVLAALSWTLHNVRSVHYVMKIDDDTYVNVPYLMNELRDRNVIKDVTHAYVMGAVCVNSSVVREEGDKWFVSHLDYPSDVYPTYVFGGGYVMTKAAAAGIVAASVHVDYLHLEDVYVTGILARAAGVHHLPHPGFVYWNSRRPSPCDLVTGRKLTAVNLTAKEFSVLYSAIHAILRTGNWSLC